MPHREEASTGTGRADAEDTDTSLGVKIADIVITDDALGTNNITLAGADAASFEIVGSELRLKAGTTVDTLGLSSDTGYTTELAIDLTGMGYPLDLGDGRLFGTGR